MAIVIPFRKRDRHLKLFLEYMLPLFQRQQMEFKVYIVNQVELITRWESLIRVQSLSLTVRVVEVSTLHLFAAELSGRTSSFQKVFMKLSVYNTLSMCSNFLKTLLKAI